MLKAENTLANNRTPIQSIKDLNAGNVESETNYHLILTIMFTI